MCRAHDKSHAASLWIMITSIKNCIIFMTHHAWPDKDMCAHTVVVHVQTIQYILYIIFPCTSLHHHRSDHFKWMTRQGHVHFKLICLNMIASHCCSELWPNSSGSFWHSCIAIANYVSCSFYYRLCTCTEHLPNWAYKQENFLGERWDITVSHPIHFSLVKYHYSPRAKR